MSVAGMEGYASSSQGGTAAWKELARDGKLKVNITASEGSQSKGFLLGVRPDGTIKIPHDHPAAAFYKMEDGKMVFKGKFTEIIEVAGKDNQGRTHIRPLATAVGEGRSRITAEVTETMRKSVEDYTIIPPEIKSPDLVMPPFIPIVPRKGLGEVRRNENNPDTNSPSTITNSAETTPGASYVNSYFGPIDPAERTSRLRRMSPRVRNGGPDVNFNQKEEFDWYLDQLGADERIYVENAAREIGELPSQVDMVVAIPVAGHEEAHNIYKTLESYLDQTLDRDKFELLLYVNNPEGLSSDDTLAEIARFKAEHPEFAGNIKVFHRNLSQDDAKIARIRKTLNDVAILRANQRKKDASEEDLIVVSNDADTHERNRRYLENFLTKLGGDSTLDAMLGQIDWDKESMMKHPALHAAARFYMFIEQTERLKDSAIGSSGANFAFKAKAYAAVGGYDASNETFGEDNVLGGDFRTMRYGAGEKQAIGFGGTRASRVYTSFRRAVYTFKKEDDAPYNQWNYGFSSTDPEIRKIDDDNEIPDLNDPKALHDVIKDTERMINRTIDTLFGGESAGTYTSSSPRVKYIERALDSCGVKFVWTDGGRHIKITNSSILVQGLKNFADKNSESPRYSTAAASESEPVVESEEEEIEEEENNVWEDDTPYTPSHNFIQPEFRRVGGTRRRAGRWTPEIRILNRVNKLIDQFVSEGYVGPGLKKVLRKELHPDKNAGHEADAMEAFKYVESLNIVS